MGHKRGNWGTEATYQDEKNSVECVESIFSYLDIHRPINGFRFRLLYSIPESLYYNRDCDFNILKEIRNSKSTHKITPDLPTIILQEIANPKNFYVVLSGDDKFQKTGGNAIERAVKNWRCVFEEKMCFNSAIVPYVIFCYGKSFIDDNNNYTPYFEAKWRQMMPYIYEGKPIKYDYNLPHSSFKTKWNQLYIQREDFTIEQKYEILKNVACEAVDYYSTLLK